jgi:hypothetical protein
MINFNLLLLAVLTCMATTVVPQEKTPLPEMTSKYNRGGTNSPFAGRKKDKDGKIRRFELIDRKVLLYHGGGKVIGTVIKPVMLNMGAVKKMTVDGKEGTYLWAWKTDTGLSGWVNRLGLADPPDADAERKTSAGLNPAPPGESENYLKIDASAGTLKLKGLVHQNSKGELPVEGNRGEHYTARNPGPLDFVYLLFAVPNVQKGGTAKDSMPDGSLFVPALDEHGKMIIEVVMMYRDADFNKPVKVRFLYGRPLSSKMYGWIAGANVGKM